MLGAIGRLSFEHLPEQVPALIFQGQIERLNHTINANWGSSASGCCPVTSRALPMLRPFWFICTGAPFLVFFFLMDKPEDHR